MSRPSRTDNSFLAHVFSPKKNAKPTGLRKVGLSGLKGGRSKTRLASYNKMSAVQQEILRMAGMRDSYLTGQSSLADARRALRPKAIQAGVAKPVRVRNAPRVLAPVTPLDHMIAARFLQKVRNHAEKPVNLDTVRKEFPMLGVNADEGMLQWDYPEFKRAGREGSEYEIFVDGERHNPFWYH